jgi:stage IV sporulation protein FB
MVDRLANVNLFLAVFNMIPTFPMDGGRVLRALLATMGHTHATEVAAAVGQGVAFALGFVGLFWNPLLIFIAIFVYLAAASEAHLVAMRAMSRGVPVTNAMMTQFAKLTPQAHVDEAVQTLLRTSQSEFPVLDGADKPVGLLGRGDLIRALKQFGPDARVAERMDTQGATRHRRCLGRVSPAAGKARPPWRWSMARAGWSGSPPRKQSARWCNCAGRCRAARPGPWSHPTGA